MSQQLVKPRIIALLETPPEVLDASYSYETETDEILGYSSSDTYQLNERVSDQLLQQLHRKLRNRQSEDVIWTAILWCLRQPLPSEIAHDLIDREISTSALGHSRQDDDVQWRMAAFYDEALLTLANDRYCTRRHDLNEFQRVLDFKLIHAWMFSSLAHAESSSKAKRQAFLAAAKQHPDSEYLLQTHAVMSERRQQEKEQAANYALRLQCAASPEITDDIARELYQTQNKDICLTLLNNPHLSYSVLEEMTRLHNFAGASQIRGAAKSQLNNRKQIQNRK